MKKDLLLLLVAAIIVCSAQLAVTARVYNSPINAGIAWDFGGIEVRGEPELFLCPGNTDFDKGIFYSYPWAPLFPSLVTDC